METRTDKNTGTAVSLLGFGAMRLPSFGGRFSAVDEKAALPLIDSAYAGGINFFDTSPFYHGGTSETFLGKVLKRYPRDSFYLSEKLPVWEVSSTHDAPRIFQKQLSSCGVDYFDYYLCQFMTESIHTTMVRYNVHPFLMKMKEEGKIRSLGFSFHDTPKVLKKIVYNHEWDFVMIQLNYLDWDTLREDLQYQIAVDAGLQVMVMEPLRGGTLASLTPEAEQILKTANPEASIASWGLRYSASLPHVLTVLSGMSTMEQVADNLKTFNNFLPLSDDERGVLAQALAAYRKTGAIPCTGCQYCMQCPSGVDIPAVFNAYNQSKKNSMYYSFSHYYSLIDREHQAHNCNACGACLTHCPQHIDIPKKLKEVSASSSRTNRFWQ